jgi:hypothetical protein
MKHFIRWAGLHRRNIKDGEKSALLYNAKIGMYFVIGFETYHNTMPTGSWVLIHNNF